MDYKVIHRSRRSATFPHRTTFAVSTRTPSPPGGQCTNTAWSPNPTPVRPPPPCSRGSSETVARSHSTSPGIMTFNLDMWISSSPDYPYLFPKRQKIRTNGENHRGYEGSGPQAPGKRAHSPARASHKKDSRERQQRHQEARRRPWPNQDELRHTPREISPALSCCATPR